MKGEKMGKPFYYQSETESETSEETDDGMDMSAESGSESMPMSPPPAYHLLDHSLYFHPYLAKLKRPKPVSKEEARRLGVWFPSDKLFEEKKNNASNNPTKKMRKP